MRAVSLQLDLLPMLVLLLVATLVLGSVGSTAELSGDGAALGMGLGLFTALLTWLLE